MVEGTAHSDMILFIVDKFYGFFNPHRNVTTPRVKKGSMKYVKSKTSLFSLTQQHHDRTTARLDKVN